MPKGSSPPLGPAIGLDVGTKTIGVAFSDALGILASPHATLPRRGVRADADALAALCRERGVRHLVVGLPLELDGGEARSARLARQIGEALAERTGLAPVWIDERYSSVEAERALIAAHASRARRKEVIDQVAAVIILQSWLDHGDWSALGPGT